MVAFRKSFVVVAAIAAGLAIMSPASAAEYPEPTAVTIDLDLSASTLIVGADLGITANATAGEETPEGTLEVEAFGETYSDDQSTLEVQVTVETPVVTQREVHTIVATFTPDPDSASGRAQSRVVTAVYRIGPSNIAAAAFAPASESEDVTLLPRTDDDDDDDDNGDGNGNGDSDNGGLLPDTGGTTFWLIVLAATLLAAGASVLEVQRRRRKNAV